MSRGGRINLVSHHRIQDLVDRYGGEGAGVVGHGVGNDQFAVMNDCAATVDDVGDVTLAFVGVGLQQRHFEPADHSRRVAQVEQECSHRVLAHRSDTMRQDQPTGLGLQRRAAVAELDELPRIGRLGDQLLGIPEMKHVRVHQVNVLVVLPRQHGIEPIDLAGRARTLCCGPRNRSRC